MKNTDIRKIRKAMKKEQDAKRYEHTLGVAYTATALAMRYEVSLKAAELAGLLHDCAKCMSDQKLLSICEKKDIRISEIEKRNPFLLHGKVGSFLAIEEYGVSDPDVVNAILNHTTGRPGMSLLEKIVFVADYIEPNRKNAPNLPEIRKLAFIDLDQCLVVILQNILEYLKSSDGEIDQMTQKTYEFYRNEVTINE